MSQKSSRDNLPLLQSFTNEQSRSLYRLAVAIEVFLNSKDFVSLDNLEKANLELQMNNLCMTTWNHTEKLLKPENNILQVSLKDK